MTQQASIKFPISIAGVGVHTGEKSKIIIHPAKENTGIVFRIGAVEVPAVLSSVISTHGCTVLGVDGARVMTVEHLMAAIAGAELHNLVIEVIGPEIPILDGSAFEFYFALQSAGREVFEVALPRMVLHEEVRLEEGHRSCVLMPREGWHLDFEFVQPRSVCMQQHPSATFVAGQDVFEHDLARARTFGFLEDYEKLKQQQRAQGASLENVVVLDQQGCLNPSGMRFENEPARHKLLDVFGDFRLLGPELHAHFLGRESNHAMHYRLMMKSLPYWSFS